MNKIKEIRTKKGLKLGYLAKITKISTGYLNKLERGEKTNPSYNVMLSIAKVSQLLEKK